MELREIFSMLGLFSKFYFLGMALLVSGYLIRHICLHAKLSGLGRRKAPISTSTIDLIRDHCTGLREAEHIALGLARALFAAQLSQLLFLFTPMMRATDIEPWLSVPHFLIICQLCFLPVLLLLMLDWFLSIHLRSVTRRR